MTMDQNILVIIQICYFEGFLLVFFFLFHCKKVWISQSSLAD